MTKVSYIIEDTVIDGSVFNPNFLLSNKIGGFISLGGFPISKYQGVIFNENFRVFKAIENIIPLNCAEVSEVKNKFFEVARKRGDITEEFFMPLNKNALIYRVSEEKEIQVDMDARNPYDSREFGRFYNVYSENNKTIIEFRKKTDKKEDNSHGKNEYSIFVVVNTPNFKLIDKWHQVGYPFDQERNSAPYDRHVYGACSFMARELVFTFSQDKNTAIEDNDYVSENIERLKTEYEIYVNGFKKRTKNVYVNVAYKAAQSSLDSLVQKVDNIKGIYAGLYWFFQYWTRDEAISINALIKQKKYDLVKDVLFKEIDNIRPDGSIHSIYPKQGLKSADAVGWVFKRTDEFISTLQKEGIIHEFLSESDLKFIKDKLEDSVFSLIKSYTFKDVVINGKNETWMDTGYDDDYREGARIEIQALRLSMYKLLKELSRHLKDSIGLKMAEHLESDLKEKTRSLFWNGKYLKDGADDDRIRPNVFIAYYVYPDLLTKKEWVLCFKNVMPKLWNEWGGLSTIDKSDRMFFNNHTGEDNRSYHRGDSWYWINNLAALCLARIGKIKFRKYINKIVEASTNEILWSGLVGHHAEISSSSKMQSKGCLAQAWSAALYIEMIDEIY